MATKMLYKPTCSKCGPLESWVSLMIAMDQVTEHRRALPSHEVSLITRGTSTKDAKTLSTGE